MSLSRRTPQMVVSVPASAREVNDGFFGIAIMVTTGSLEG